MNFLFANLVVACLYFSCKAVDQSSEGCEPVSGGIPVTNIKLDIDSDREVEKIHSLFLQYMEKLEALQGIINWLYFYSQTSIIRSARDRRNPFE